MRKVIGSSPISSTRNKTVGSTESAVFIFVGWFMREPFRFEGKDLPMRSSGSRLQPGVARRANPQTHEAAKLRSKASLPATLLQEGRSTKQRSCGVFLYRPPNKNSHPKRDGCFLFWYGIPDIGLERRLLATCRWQVATAVAFPQKSESIPAEGRSFLSSTRNKTVDSTESAVFRF